MRRPKILRIQVNGEAREVAEHLTLPELIASLNLKPEQIAVELNQSVVRRAEWPERILREGDKVEIVHFVGGGCGLFRGVALPAGSLQLSHTKLETAGNARFAQTRDEQ